MWEKKLIFHPETLSEDEVGISIVHRWNWGEGEIRIDVKLQEFRGEIRMKFQKEIILALMPKFLKVKFYGPLKSHFEIKKSQIQNFLGFLEFWGSF